MTATPQPLYDIDNANPAYHLRYSWTGWPAGGSFATCPTSLLETLADGFAKDGLRLLEHRWTPELVQLTLSSSPTVSPAMLAQRVKGRLDHAIRQAKLSLPFSRKLAVRSLGENRRVDVEKYIREQVSRERFVDTGFEQKLKSYTVVNSNVDLVVPTASARGRYWYNLHVVLVTQARHRIADVNQLCVLRDTCDKIAEKKGYAISSLSLMPDHLHVALRGNIEHSPAEIGRCFQNNLAYAVGNSRLWADGFYVGSFGEYNMDAVRRLSQSNLSHHPDELDGAVRNDRNTTN
ncbi:MAG: transposase [Planctomycetota bacterium]|nr:transposase [Planctomycetota bacterium]